jgi:hypothetical protein
MKPPLTLALVAVVTVVGTAAHGFVTGRWQPHGPTAEAALPAVPMTLGEWRGEDLKSGVDEPVLKNLTRKYMHARSGRVLTLSLTAGPAGLTAQHTPEYCYPGSGYEAIGTTQAFAVGDDGFRTAVYRKAKAGADALRIYWAWTNDGHFSAPKLPELEVKFLRGNLTKLYVVSWDADRPPERDAELQEFMAAVLAAFPKGEAK